MPYAFELFSLFKSSSGGRPPRSEAWTHGGLGGSAPEAAPAPVERREPE